MDRFVLTDAQWARMAPLCLSKLGGPGRSGKDNRLFVEADLRIARTGSPSRDLLLSVGHWNSVFTRFRDWAKADVWKRLFEAVSTASSGFKGIETAGMLPAASHNRRCPQGPR